MKQEARKQNLKKKKTTQPTDKQFPHTCHSRLLNFYQNEQIHDHQSVLLVASELEFDCSIVDTRLHKPAGLYDATARSIADVVDSKRMHRRCILRIIFTSD